MKHFLLSIATLICFHSFSQTVADSTIKHMADFNCSCQDTINIHQDNEKIRFQMRECFTKSLVTYLNKRELPPDYLNDNKQISALQKEIFNKLSDCKSTVWIANKLMDIPIPADSIPQELFITEAFFNKHGLKRGQIAKNFIVWNSDKNEHISRVVDIRWVFKTNEDALKFHKAKLKENSEGGTEIEFKSKISNASELHVYKEGKEMENMIKMMNLPSRHHYFLFVVNNVVFKVFVATDKTLEAKAVKFIAEEAANRMKQYKP